MVQVTEEEVLEVLKDCYDPEIPVNVVDLGLVYKVDVSPENRVYVEMTMTAPGCPFHETLTEDAQDRLMSIPGVSEAEVQIVWDPPWTPELISEDGKAQLGWN
jgi:FeS assembly SUF system protein